jgi:hypothetical protein
LEEEMRNSQNNTEESFKTKSANFQWCFVAMEEITDVCEAAERAISARGIDLEFSITEELAALMSMKGTTAGADMYEVEKALHNLNIQMQKLIGLMTHTAPSMVGRNSGVSSFITNDVKSTTNRDLIIRRCLIHQRDLCTKSFKVTNVVTVVSKFVSFVRSEGMNRRQCRGFLSDVESEYGDALHYTEFRWLSHGRMLNACST